MNPMKPGHNQSKRSKELPYHLILPAKQTPHFTPKSYVSSTAPFRDGTEKTTTSTKHRALIGSL
jgi:hypothetical protein